MELNVVMSVYNGERYLRQAVESILAQTFGAFEFIIIDDASTDSTPDILTDFAAADDRIRLLTNPHNLGLTRSLNKGIAAARGTYIARMDDDDISLPGRFAAQIAYLRANPDVPLVSCNLGVINTAGEVTSHPQRSSDPDLIRWTMHLMNYIGAHSQVMLRRDAVEEVGGYDENQPYSQDYDLWVRLMALGPLAILPDELHLWRKHAANITATRAAEQTRISLKISQQALAALLGGTRPPLEDIQRLRDFWLGRPTDPTAIDTVEAWLQAMVRAFPEAGASIRRATAARYVERVRHMLHRNHPISLTMQALWYAMRWHAPHTLPLTPHVAARLARRVME